MSDHILVEQDGPVATVVFNRPKMRNAISLAMWSEIAAVTDRLSKDDTVRAIVYRGAGTDAFASGRRHLRVPGEPQGHRDRAQLQPADRGRLLLYPGVPEAHGGDGLRLLHGRRHGARDGGGFPLRGGRLEVRHPGRAAQHHLRARSGASARGPGRAGLRQGHPLLGPHRRGGGGAPHRLHPAPGPRRRARGLHLRLPEEGRGQRAALGAGNQGSGAGHLRGHHRRPSREPPLPGHHDVRQRGLQGRHAGLPREAGAPFQGR